MSFTAAYHWVMGAFTPEHMAGDLPSRQRMQRFIVSHIVGPIIATPVLLLVWSADPHPWPHLAILSASVYGFWLLLALVTLFPRAYTPLAMASVLNLSFAVLWGIFSYGGVSSPFLVWFVLPPLLAFLYLGSTWMARVSAVGATMLGLVALYGIYRFSDVPVHIPVEGMVAVGVLSALAASICIFMMAAYLGSVVDKQSALITKIEQHDHSLKALTDAKDEAERANGAKSDFLAKMSHELRTPLSAVLGYSKILLEDAELRGRSEQIADLQKISVAGRHMLAMVDDILEIAKIEAGKLALHIEAVDVNGLLDEIEAVARPMAAKNINTLVVERGEALGTMRTDATRLRQTVLSLLSNAAKFTRNGTITISSKRIGGWIEIAVTDTGIGMSQEQLAQFANFTQADAKIAAVYGGTGLGLSLSQNLCRLMGGTLELDSDVDKGSRFVIHLPAQVAQVDAMPIEMSPVQPEMLDGTDLTDEPKDDRPAARSGRTGGSEIDAGQDKRERLLVVDDDRNFLELAERVLMRENYVPICTDAPQSALQIARTVRPTAIFLDILMPGFDGWDVLAALKADPTTADIPVFMISILAERSKALAAGADGIVLKPLDAAKVKAALAALKSTRARLKAAAV